jgi:hypothetical protein
MADLCQTDYERVRPDRYFPEDFDPRAAQEAGH